MKTCPKCGNQLDDSMKFCNNCGSPVDDAKAATPATTTNFVGDHTAEFSAEEVSKNKVFALVCYCFSVLGVVLAMLACKDSEYVMFHARNSLKISVCMALVAFANIVPFLGTLVCGVCEIILTVCIIICFVNTAKGLSKDAPIVGGFGFLR